MSHLEATAEMLVHASPPAVFAAFVEPRMLERFWLRRASAPLAPGAVVEWEFLVDGAHETVTVTEFVADQRIRFDWSDGIAVSLDFAAHGKGATRLSVCARGFGGDDAAARAINATEGFSIVLCDLKCLLETGTSGHMVRDKAALISADTADR
ncbi:MAG: SRPBCC domain-containing protein [Pseudoxanthomonas sp.]